MFLAKSEVDDRRPLVACGNGDTVCADCYNECCKRPDGKCPTCGDGLLPSPIVNKALIELIQNCATVLEIPVKEIEMNKEPFARGGFGKVYEAKWRKENVAIKVITVDSEKKKQAVKGEANLSLHLNHPNVVKLFGITCVKSRKLGIVMEKAERGSLDKWIGQIKHEKLTRIALGVIDGLKYVHSKSVIHRNIRPNNILMFGPSENDMTPKIADFGVSKVIEKVMGQTKVGDELYMAPEVKVYSQHSYPADIFSLATMLFEMFNQQLILDSSSDVKRFIMAAHNGRIGDFPKGCKVPEYIRKIVERGWHENPEKRPSLDEYYSTIQG